MTRNKKIILGIIITALAIPVVAVIFLLAFDWNRARPWLNARVSEAIERPFQIAGDLSVRWVRPAETMRPADRRWRDHIPWPHLRARDVHVGNPANMEQRDSASAREFSFSLDPFALLGKRIHIPVLSFDTPRVALERLPDGRNNWTLKPQEKKSAWTLDLDRVVFSKGTVHVKDAITRADITADVDSLPDDPTYGVGWTMRGLYNGAAVKGGGKAGAVLSLKSQTTPYPLKASVEMGTVNVAAEGTLTKPTRLAALDMRLKVGGASMARLYPLTGLLLPETPPFRTEGRLVGKVGADDGRWTYQNFTGTVGSSDIGGSVDYQIRAPRGLLTANVRSRRLDFKDLGPIIGADSNASKIERGVQPVQPNNKVLPVETFRTDRWTAIDADVSFAADHIIREKELPISKLSTHLLLKNGIITLDPLSFGVAGGTMSSTIKLDSQKRKDVLLADAKVTARHIKLKQLFPQVEQMKATIGEINGEARLSATGNSVATLLANSNGEIKALINQGTVSKLLLEQMGLNIGNIVLTKLFGDKPVQLNCLASDLIVKDGVAGTRSFVADTDEAVIRINGTVDLSREQLDLTLKPETKGLRIISLRAPIYIRGPFKQPDVSIDKGVLALKAGSAAALAAVSPLAALLPLINAGPGKDSPCGALLADAREKPQAPPAAKSLPKH
jgi:uncharacterized protein involved in outer membrane biogenesis